MKNILIVLLLLVALACRNDVEDEESDNANVAPPVVDKCSKVYPANFERLDYSGCDFSGKTLDRVNLYGAVLDKTNFSNAILTRVNLSYSTGAATNFSGAKISDADFSNSSFSGASFTGANISNTILSRSTLEGVNFSDSKFSKTDFSYSKLDGVTFAKSNLTNPKGESNQYFNGAELINVTFKDLEIDNSNFQYVTFKDTVFTNVKMGTSSFSNSKFNGIDFSGIKRNKDTTLAFSNAVFAGKVTGEVENLCEYRDVPVAQKGFHCGEWYDVTFKENADLRNFFTEVKSSTNNGQPAHVSNLGKESKFIMSKGRDIIYHSGINFKDDNHKTLVEAILVPESD